MARKSPEEKLYDDIERVDDLCHHGWNTTVRLSSPGFDVTHIGLSTWCCDDCAPMVAKLIDAVYGGHDEAGRRS